MLLPFDFAVLTVTEAKLLIEFIEKQTATKTISKNYEKIQKAGMLEIYSRLTEFVEAANNYESKLRFMDTGRFIVDNSYDY